MDGSTLPPANSRAIKIKHQVNNLGVILDSELNIDSHISNMTKIPFYHLRNIAKVWKFLSKADTERLIHAFMDTVLSGLPKKAIGQLQNIQNAAARVLTKNRWRAHITLAACEF